MRSCTKWIPCIRNAIRRKFKTEYVKFTLWTYALYILNIHGGIHMKTRKKEEKTRSKQQCALCLVDWIEMNAIWNYICAYRHFVFCIRVVNLSMAVTVFIFRAMIIANAWYCWSGSARIKEQKMYMKKKVSDFGIRGKKKSD